MAKRVDRSGPSKNFTVRLGSDITALIKERAELFDMSQPYFITALVKLEVREDLLKKFGDPLQEKKPEISREEALEMVNKLKAAGVDIDSMFGDGKIPTNPETVTLIPQGAPPTKPVKPQKAKIIPPQMKTPQDLIRLQSQLNPAAPDPEIIAKIHGGVGSVSAQMREIQLREAKEEKAEREMRKRILEESENNGENEAS